MRGLLWILMLAALPARAAELELEVGASVRTSAWRGDWAAGPQVGAGLRLMSALSLNAAVSTELATVDQRLNTGLTVGVAGILPRRGWRPVLRAYFLHQHEEGLVSVRRQPLGALLGIGAGIRHRAGAGGRLGMEIPLGRRRGMELVALVLVDASWFPDASLGPSWYLGLSGGLGVRHALEALR